MTTEIKKLKAENERLKKELKERKKYGLVWEEKPEEIVEMCKEKLPVLKEIKNKEIITDKDKPVNLLIEGDNYHALSVLNYTHAKKSMLFTLIHRIIWEIKILFSTTTMLIEKTHTVTQNGLRLWRKD